MQETLALNEIANTLEQLGSNYSPAYTHGSVCGFLCAGTHISGKMAPLALHSEITCPRRSQALLKLYHISCQQLFSLDGEFHMLLPNDNEPLAIRATALSEWCQGFLSGIRLAGIKVRNAVLKDVLRCLKELAEINYEEVLFSTADEAAYQETLRYVRFATLLIHAEIGYQPAAYQSDYLH
jgi:uncharacterized protein YgfB (UPF0149 family)